MARPFLACLLCAVLSASFFLSPAAAAAAPQQQGDHVPHWQRVLLGNDLWASAPACAAKPSNSNSKADSMGRLWGYEAGASCAFKDDQQQALQPGQPAPAVQQFSSAPPCPDAPTADNSMSDRQGQLWGVSWGISCAFKTPLGGPAYYTTYAGPRVNTTRSPQPELPAMVTPASPQPAAAVQPPPSLPPVRASPPPPAAKPPFQASPAPPARLPMPIFGMPLTPARRPNPRPSTVPLTSPSTSSTGLSSPSPAPLSSPRPSPSPAPLSSPIPSPSPAPLSSPRPSPSPAPLSSPIPSPSPAPLSSPSPSPSTEPLSSPSPSPHPSPAAAPTPAASTPDLASKASPATAPLCSCPQTDVDQIATAIATQLWQKLADASNSYESVKASSADAAPPTTSDGVREQQQQVLRLSSLLTAIQTLAQQAAQAGTDTAAEAPEKPATAAANSDQTTFRAAEAADTMEATNTATAAYPIRPSAQPGGLNNLTSSQDAVGTSSPALGAGSVKAISWIAELQDKKQPVN